MDLVELRRIASEATPGPWTTDGEVEQHEEFWSRYVDISTPGFEFGIVVFTPDEESDQAVRNAAHVAAFSPSVVLALLDELEALRDPFTVALEQGESEE